MHERRKEGVLFFIPRQRYICAISEANCTDVAELGMEEKAMVCAISEADCTDEKERVAGAELIGTGKANFNYYLEWERLNRLN